MDNEGHIYEMMNMTRDEATAALERYPVAILPLGATEQHGHHLPLGVDIYLAEGLAKEVCRRTGAMLLPAMPFGYSWVWRDIPGTVSLQQHHVEAVIKDVAHSVARWGVKLLVLINGHDANNTSMKYAARELADELDMSVLYLFYPNLNAVMQEHCVSETWNGMIHACEFETSLMLAVQPEQVRMELANREYPEIDPLYGKTTLSLGSISESGVFGDPVPATAEKGRAMLGKFADEMADLVNLAYEKYAAQG